MRTDHDVKPLIEQQTFGFHIKAEWVRVGDHDDVEVTGAKVSHEALGLRAPTNAMGMGLRPSVLVLTDNESCVLPAEHCEERMTDIERRLQSLEQECEERMTDIERRLQSLEQEGREPQMNAMRLVHFVFALLANIGKMLAYACGYACGLFL